MFLMLSKERRLLIQVSLRPLLSPFRNDTNVSRRISYHNVIFLIEGGEHMWGYEYGWLTGQRRSNEMTYWALLNFRIEAALQHTLNGRWPALFNIRSAIFFNDIIDQLMPPPYKQVWGFSGEDLPQNNGEGVNVCLQIVSSIAQTFWCHVPFR